MNPEQQPNRSIESMGYYNIPTESATVEKPELELDKMLEIILASEAAVKINEGQKGIILELDTTNLPDEVRDYFSANLEDDGEDDEKIAVKLLKIYSGSEGRKEYDLQKKARKILKEEKIEGVKVPKPRNFRELSVSDEEVIKHLESLGIKIGPSKVVEIISMDLIRGRDLATLMYETYVREHEKDFQEMYPDLELEEYLKQIDINSLINLVHHLAGIKTKYSNFDESPQASQERAHIARLINQDIAYKGILEKKHANNLLKAINTLHDKGIYHRDLHPRNVMIDVDGNLEIIDFGSAKEINPNNQSEVNDVYVAGPEAMHLSDHGIVNIAQQLAKTEVDRKEENRISRLGDPDSLVARLSTRRPKQWADFLAAVHSGEDINKTIGVYEAVFNGDVDHKVRMALLLEISKQGRQAEVITHLKNIIEIESTKKKHLRSDFLINQYQSLLDFIS